MPVLINEIADAPNSNGTSSGTQPPGANGSIQAHEFVVKVNGTEISRDAAGDIVELTVENSLHLPDLCTIQFNCWDGQKQEFKWLDDDTFAVGNKIEIKGGYGSNLSTLFFGEITGLDMDLSALNPPTFLVRALDKSHRLHRGRKSRSFVQVKDSDLVEQLAGEAGLTVGKIDQTSGVHDWVFQNNQTNWEFLNARANRAGFRLYVEGDGILNFRRVVDDAPDTVSVRWGDELRSFRPRISAGHQVNEVKVRGWDRQKKQVILGSSQKAADSQGGRIAKSAFGPSEMHIVNRPIFSQEEATVLAQSVLDNISGEYLEGDGLCDGMPALMPGKLIEIGNCVPKYNGKYFVTSTTHTFTPAEGYTTLFSINGKRSGNLLSALTGGGGGGTGASAGASDGGNGGGGSDGSTSIGIGIVTDNNDPLKQGRVKVKYPWNSDNDTSDWASIAVPMAGGGRGFYFLPEINDEVLVGFEHGDIRRPYILGALWNGVDAPPEGNDVAVVNNQVVHRIIKTRIGHTILLDDTDGTGEMKMTTNGGHFLTLNDRDKNITAQTTSGHKVLLDDQNNKIVIVDSSGNNSITIDTNSSNIECVCAQDFKITATGKVIISGNAGIEISTPMQAKMSGQTGVEVSGLTVDVKADAELTLKGAMASLSGDVETTIKGTMVMIN
jgi:phage protein D/phage baseplate assembly protein gpV